MSPRSVPTSQMSPSVSVAPLSFPVPVVNIRKIRLVAYDNQGGDGRRVCVTLHRGQPLKGTTANVGRVCTADNSDHPQLVASTPLDNRRVNTVNHAPYLWVNITAPGLSFYGAQVVYSY